MATNIRCCSRRDLVVAQVDEEVERTFFWSADVSADLAVEFKCAAPADALATNRIMVPESSQREFCNKTTLRADMEVGQYGLGNQYRGPIRAG